MQPILTLGDRVLARVVGSVAEPDLQSLRARLVHRLDAAPVRIDGLAADRAVGVRQRPELVLIALEDVGVDVADLDALLVGVAGQCREVLHLIPRDMQRDPRRDPRVFVNLSGVGDLLEWVTWRARRRKHLEARSGITEGPARQLDALLRQQALRLRAQVAEAGHLVCSFLSLSW